MPTDPRQVLQQYWGYESFRPMQEDIIRSVLAGKDTLALLPTGGGKSICFQVPALCQEGICVVVSPLIALMKDQVYQLQQRGIKAEAIYSGMTYTAIDRILDNCVYGDIKFLYLSPERLRTDLAIERIKKMQVNLLAVDEAHCISQWGYDFRPSYLQIADLRPHIPGTPVIALTATATEPVVEDIQHKLLFREEQVLRKSFRRENLAYVVLNEEGKLAKALEILRKVGGSSVIYVRSRRRTKELVQALRRNKILADYYHAGLNNEVRATKQEAWIKGELPVIVSTNAFGMGIDKPDVRSVIHMDLPDSLEAYFQEAGRAGRDGQKAFAVLLYQKKDSIDLQRKFELSFPPLTEIRRVYQALGAYYQLATGSGQGETFDFDISDFVKTYDMDALTTFSCLKILEQSEWLTLTEAVYIPSSLIIKVKKEQLYDYQLRHRKFDPIIKTILRTYQGAMNNYVNIREYQLSRFLNIDLQELREAFLKMQKDGVVIYRPQKDKPQLTFLQERVEPQNLTIDTQLYKFRKERHRERIKKVIAYAEEVRCRSQQLLRYFGEESEPCGTCDVCLGRTQAEVSPEEYERYKEKVRQLLKKEKLSIDLLLDSFSPRRKNKVLKVVEYLLDEGFVEQKEELLYWRKN